MAASAAGHKTATSSSGDDAAPEAPSSKNAHGTGAQQSPLANGRAAEGPTPGAPEDHVSHQAAAASHGAANGSSEHTGDAPPSSHTNHYWGQALQYLDRAVHVEADTVGRRITVVAKQDGSRVCFALRQGVGGWVDRAPWRIEWGGGSSVENPHYQRVHYCELLVSELCHVCNYLFIYLFN